MRCSARVEGRMLGRVTGTRVSRSPIYCCRDWPEGAAAGRKEGGRSRLGSAGRRVDRPAHGGVSAASYGIVPCS